MSGPQIRSLLQTDFSEICLLTDKAFGDSYVTPNDLARQWAMMNQGELSASFVLEQDGKIVGFRITFLPGRWGHEKEGKKSLKHLWNHPIPSVAYFKTSLVTESLRGQGWGRQLAMSSFAVLKKLGAKAIITHSWNESPANSSRHYLAALGFQPVGKIENFWAEASYDCSECHQLPCTCSATEMILELK